MVQTMITLTQYFIGRKHTDEQEANAQELLSRVNGLIGAYIEETGNDIPINTHSNSMISGLTEGGFRLPECVQGAATSSHKEAKGVDVNDPDNKLDTWISQKVLKKFDLYREAEQYTLGWCHLTTRPPKSGCRSFLP